MNAFYEWLYEQYAEPRMDEALLDPAYHTMKEPWLEMEKKLSPDDTLTAEDYIGSLKLNWGTLAFYYGIKAGVMLYAGLIESQQEADYFPSPRSLMI